MDIFLFNQTLQIFFFNSLFYVFETDKSQPEVIDLTSAASPLSPGFSPQSRCSRISSPAERPETSAHLGRGLVSPPDSWPRRLCRFCFYWTFWPSTANRGRWWTSWWTDTMCPKFVLGRFGRKISSVITSTAPSLQTVKSLTPGENKTPSYQKKKIIIIVFSQECFFFF